MRYRRLLMLTIAVLMPGCSMQRAVTRMAVDYNDFVADATNRQIALNILRARDREPLHFTSFTKVVGSAQITGNAGLGVTANGTTVEKTPGGGVLNTAKRTLGSTNLTPQVNVQVQSGTNFEIAINATDEFWKGILSSVPPPMLVYYLRQGWSPEMISYLFVDRLEYSAQIAGPDGRPVKSMDNTVLVLSNDPGNASDMRAFENAVRCRELSYRLQPAKTRTLPLASPQELAGIAPDLAGSIGVARKDEGDDTGAPDNGSGGDTADLPYVLEQRSPQDFVITMSQPKDPSACDAVGDQLLAGFGALADDAGDAFAPRGQWPARLVPKDKTLPALLGNQARPMSSRDPTATNVFNGSFSFVSRDGCTELVKPGYRCDIAITATLRSTEGVIYYLGEYIRDGAERPLLRNRLCTPDQPYCLPILAVERGRLASGELPFTEVEFKGARYYIPSTGEKLNTTAGRSSEVLTLVEQLLNLYRSVKDFPSTPFVKVIN